jgi:hypothetical protein
MPRRLIWIESQKFAGFGCSECQWVFKSTGALVGLTLDQMKKEYEAERGREFAAHACPAPKIYGPSRDRLIQSESSSVSGISIF